MTALTLKHFFDNLQAPSITTAHKTETELPPNHVEILSALKAMQNGKAPGPDGYPIEFYKKFYRQTDNNFIQCV